MDQENLLSNETESSVEQLIITMILLGVVVFLGTIGNILVLIVYYRRRHTDQSSETDYFFINSLALSDLVVCVLIVSLTMIVEWYNFHISFFFCKMYYLLNTANLLFSTMLIALIAIDRCLCIKYPLRKILTVPKAKIVSAFLLLFAFLMGIVGAALVDNRSHSHNATSLINREVCEEIIFQDNVSEKVKTFYQIYEKSTHSIYIFSIIIVIICYILIYIEIIKIRQREKNMLFKHNRESKYNMETDGCISSDPNNSPVEKSLLKQRRSLVQGFKETALFRNIRSAAILFVVAVVYILVFTPVILIITFKVVKFNIILYNLYYLNNAANPLVYCFMNSKFRRDLSRLIKKSRLNCLKKKEDKFNFPSRLGGSLAPTSVTND